MTLARTAIATAVLLICGCNPADRKANRELEEALRGNPDRARHEWAVRVEYADHAPRRPPIPMVERIERQLAEIPCIGPMDRWARRFSYGYDLRRGGLDTTRVDFFLQEAGVWGFRSGRQIVSPGRLAGGSDDRPYKFAAGSFYVRTEEVDLQFCGPNVASR